MGPLTLRAELERWPLVTPFRITGHIWEVVDVVLVTLEKDGRTGRGEAGGVYYRNDRPDTILRQIESSRSRIEAGISRSLLQELLPPGGARNALDCALWDLEAKLSGCSAWQLAGLEKPQSLLARFTCSADEPEKMASTARSYANARAIKLKLTGEASDADRVRAVRDAREDAWLAVDANQGFSRASLEQLIPVLTEARVALIEQPFPVGEEYLLDGFRSPIPIAADESVQGIADIPALVGRFDAINIKLDKCGGLTEGIVMAKTAQDAGLTTMVGNMLGTSLAMAPGCLLGQFCDWVELDGPIAFKMDREPPVRYTDGFIVCPEALWGHPDDTN